MTSPRTSRLARGLTAGGAVVRMGGAQLLHKTRQSLGQQPDPAAHAARLGGILFQALDQLKGTGLKAAQLLSLELDLLPEPLRLQLAQAHHRATPLNRAHVVQLLRREFGGRSAQQLFADFEDSAFAAASLGQVHRARSHSGQALAVKLQYPGMAAAVRSDLSLLRRLLKTPGLGMALPNEGVLSAVLADIETKVLEELDYEREADELEWFAQRNTHPQLVLPQVHRELSSARVLSLTYLDGLHLDDWLARAPSQAERDHFGQLLFDQFWHGVLHLQRIQADPHPGNFLFMTEGRLGLLDFGRTLALSDDFVQGLGQAWRAQFEGDSAGLLAAYRQLGMLGPEMDLARFRTELLPLLQSLLDWQLLPWRQPVYDFGQYPRPPTDQATGQPAGKAARERGAGRHLQGMPSELPFFDRSHVGITQLLRQLGARVRTGTLWRLNP